MLGSYNYYENTINEIAGKIKLATEAFSGKDGNYCAIPQYHPDKKVLILRVKNLPDGSNFAIFQKLGKAYGIKCYDSKGKELYEYIQSRTGDTKSTYLYYDIKNKIGISENSAIDPVEKRFYPTKVEENYFCDKTTNGSNIVHFTATKTTSPQGSIAYMTATNDLDACDWSAEESMKKSVELMRLYHLLNCNSIRDNILEFNKTFKDFILNKINPIDTSNKDNKNIPEDR